MTRLLPALFLAAAITMTSVSGEYEQLRDSKKGDGAAKFAVTCKDELVAASAFGMWLGSIGDIGADEAKVIQKFCDKQFDKGVFLLSARGMGTSAISPLMKLEERRLAAALLATEAATDYLYNQHQLGLVRAAMRDEMGEEIDPKKVKGKGKGRKKKKGKNAGGVPADTLATLLTSKDALALEYAVLAAAYSGAADVKEAVKKVPKKTPGIQAAKLLYSALVSKELKFHTLDVRDMAKQKNTVADLSPRLLSYTAQAPPLCYLMQAIAATGDEAHLKYLHQALRYRDLRVQIEAAKAMAAIGSNRSLRPAQESLSSAKWPVLIHLCQYLAKCPDISSIEPLISLLSKKKGRFRCDAVFALSAIAGQQVGGTAAEWRDWWSKNRRKFEVDPAASAEFRKNNRVQAMPVKAYGTFYEIPIVSDHLCFVVDSSKSMNGDRIASLKKSMKEILAGFPKSPRIYFNIIDFGGDIEYLVKKGLSTNVRRADQYVYDMDLSLMTRSFDAIERGALLESVDTIYFLSDGAPTSSQIKTWNDIGRGLFMMNRYRRLAVCMVSFDAKGGNGAGMLNIANENVGLYEATDVGPAGDEEEEEDDDKKKKKKKDKKKKK